MIAYGTMSAREKPDSILCSSFTIGSVRIAYEGGDADSRSYGLTNCTEEVAAKAFADEGYDAVAHGAGYRSNDHVILRKTPAFHTMTIGPAGNVEIVWERKAEDGSPLEIPSSYQIDRFQRIAKAIHRSSF